MVAYLRISQGLDFRYIRDGSIQYYLVFNYRRVRIPSPWLSASGTVLRRKSMATLLHIDSSVFYGQASSSRSVAYAFRRAWEEQYPEGMVIYRDVAANP